ncbi:hypothetical protein CsSME_00016187 [Camellia sinensis var. sinensis]
MKPRPSLQNEISQQNLKKLSCSAMLTLAYQSLGLVYGDLSTSPLYDDEEIYGVFSFIFWTFTVIALFKYIYIYQPMIMQKETLYLHQFCFDSAGGTFALFSLHARLSILPNQLDTDETLSSYASFFKKHPNFFKGLLIFVLLGTCMAIGDGILTPAISVLGVKLKFTGLHENYVIIISCVILVGLFSLQHHGTHRVAFMFAPIVTAWLLCIGGNGTYNIIKWNLHIFHALSPVYMLKFLRSTGIEGWVYLGGVVLLITGVEAMFADLGHFSTLSMMIAFTFLVYSCLVLAYLGEAAFLSRHHEDIQRSFYKAIPEPISWPVFIVATFAAMIGSRAVISATFSIISQCCALNCFPLVKIIYIPEVNWMLMFLCLTVTIGLRDSNMIGHAYGLAVTSVMFVSTCLMAMVMLIVCKQNIVTTFAFLAFFGSVELLYLSAALYEVPEGGWIPLVLSSIFMAVMFLWNYGTLGMVRVPGIGLVYTNLMTGVPAIFGHFVTNLPAFHQVVVFICIKSVQVPYVNEKERFLISKVGPKEYGMFRCVVKYGYKDLQQENYDFENRLVCMIIKFVEKEGQDELHEEKIVHSLQDFHVMGSMNGRLEGSSLKDVSWQILTARESGVAYILGHSYAQAKKSSSIFKKLAIGVVYAFLSKNCRGPDVALSVPHTSLLEVGMIYYV